MTAPGSVDFVIVAYHNERETIIDLSSALLRTCREAGRPAAVYVVVNDDTRFPEETTPPGVRVLSGHGNVGFARGMKLGLAAGDGQHVVLVNPDCLPDDDALRDFYGHLIPGCGILVPRLLTGDGEFDYAPYENWTFSPGRKIAEYLCRERLDGPTTRLLPRFAKAPGAFLGMERTVAEQLDGPFDSTFFLYAEDRDMTDRARQAQIPLWFLPGISVTHLGGQSGTNVSSLVSACKTDGTARVAYRRLGRAGAALALADMFLVSAIKRTARRGGTTSPQVRAAERWALRRWIRSGFRETPPLDQGSLRAVKERTTA
ncbi:glycosyltransferase family 2 protein [Sanguibacter suaedae]|uniref:Glycosyltransferase family 2 protein n=1 Tax=Sanguibacter suaedae TaxID=2795737 RepID=A0A934MCA7_9MICO|nr:glycosyltransferase [Sanguibacter suaedae]MBI9116201.1 glycosyltransferase family 2 protein [Sanguibacter suaedae]